MSGPRRHDNTRGETRRYRVKGTFPGRLVTTDGSFISVRPLDVSRRGLAFIANRALESGRQYWLEVGTKRVRVEVAYCESHLGIENMFRCGTFTRDPEENFEKLFADLDMLAEVLPSPFEASDAA